MTRLSSIFLIILFITGILSAGCLGFGTASSQSRGSSPSENATQWEKEHPGIPQCSSPLEIHGLSIYSPEKDQVGAVAILLETEPAGLTINMTKTTYLVSTSKDTKTFSSNNPAVHLIWDGQRENFNDVLDPGENVTVVLDIPKLGFTPETFGPDKKFVILITPERGCNATISKTVPHSLPAGGVTEVS